MEKRRKWAIIGLAAIVPALLLVTMGLSGLEPFKLLDSPFLILGGIALAVATNLPLAMNLDLHQDDGNFVSSVTLNLREGLMNFGVIVLSVMLFSIIALYLFFENFQPR